MIRDGRRARIFRRYFDTNIISSGITHYPEKYYITINILNKSPALPTVTEEKKKRLKSLIIDSDSDWTRYNI